MSTTIDLINTGILMGMIHVLTGPDHLSALATLCGTNITTRSNNLEGFLLGIRWGIGHSIGLLVVGTVLIAVEEQNSDWIGMDNTVSTTLETFVGLFMLALGSYGLLKAFRNRAIAETKNNISMAESQSKESLHATHLSMRTGLPPTPTSQTSENRRGSVEIVAQMADVLNRDGDSMRRTNSDFLENDDGDDDVEMRIFNAVESLRKNSNSFGVDDSDVDDSDRFLSSLKTRRDSSNLSSNDSSFTNKAALSRSFVKIMNTDRAPMKASSLVHKHAAPENSIALAATAATTHAHYQYCYNLLSNSRLAACCTPGMLAVVTGIVHGVAGPGGVLGVIPAVQLRDAKLASVYLGTFCVTSILVMGCFAAFYGTFSEWLAGAGRGGRQDRVSRVFFVEFGSAFLSFAVGIVWLVLLSIGMLDEVFQ